MEGLSDQTIDTHIGIIMSVLNYVCLVNFTQIVTHEHDTLVINYDPLMLDIHIYNVFHPRVVMIKNSRKRNNDRWLMNFYEVFIFIVTNFIYIHIGFDSRSWNYPHVDPLSRIHQSDWPQLWQLFFVEFIDITDRSINCPNIVFHYLRFLFGFRGKVLSSWVAKEIDTSRDGNCRSGSGPTSRTDWWRDGLLIFNYSISTSNI